MLQYMMSLLGEDIILDEKTTKVIRCPGLSELEPDQDAFEEWVKE